MFSSAPSQPRTKSQGKSPSQFTASSSSEQEDSEYTASASDSYSLDDEDLSDEQVYLEEDDSNSESSESESSWTSGNGLLAIVPVSEDDTNEEYTTSGGEEEEQEENEAEILWDERDDKIEIPSEESSSSHSHSRSEHDHGERSVASLEEEISMEASPVRVLKDASRTAVLAACKNSEALQESDEDDTIEHNKTASPVSPASPRNSNNKPTSVTVTPLAEPVNLPRPDLLLRRPSLRLLPSFTDWQTCLQHQFPLCLKEQLPLWVLFPLYQPKSYLGVL